MKDANEPPDVPVAYRCVVCDYETGFFLNRISHTDRTGHQMIPLDRCPSCGASFDQKTYWAAVVTLPCGHRVDVRAVRLGQPQPNPVSTASETGNPPGENQKTGG